MSQLPPGWTKAPLSQLGTWTGGGTPDTANAQFWTNGDIPWVSPKDMKQSRISTTQDSITKGALASSATKLIPANSVLLVTRSGILRHSLPVALNAIPVTLNQDLKALTPARGLNPEFLHLSFQCFERDLLHACCKGGTTVQSIEMARLLAFEVPIPPVREQQRIVAKIEDLFSELDKGIENLKLARAQLAVYRQALLKHAFEGKLTADWREEQAGQVQSGKRLSSETQGARKTDPITSVEAQALPTLPLEWAYARLGTFITSITAGKSFSCDERRPRTEDVGVAKVSAVTWGEYQESESKTCTDPTKINPTYFIRPGDFLLSRANTIELVGACVIVKRVTQRIMLSDKTLRIVVAGLPQEFLLHYLRSRLGRKEIMSHSTGNQESMRNIGQDGIHAIVVPVCSTVEATKIVALLDNHFDALALIEVDIETNLQRAEALRHSILRTAFAGELVPQDPADEPASELLARIRAERAQAVQPVKAKSTRTPRAANA